MAKFNLGKLSLLKDKRIWFLVMIVVLVFSIVYMLRMVGLYEGLEGSDVVPSVTLPETEALTDATKEEKPKESSCANKPNA